MLDEQYSRQSFLGGSVQKRFQAVKVAIIGLGGGGSHIAQQLAHLGILNYVLYDPQTIELSNLNRMVGARRSDVGALKILVAQRIILDIQPKANVYVVADRWQKMPELLRGCDIIFGCVDTFKDRNELEASARRYLIPYIDIGMDIFKIGNELPRMVGQVILSLPGSHCLRCLDFITEQNLGNEASNYGAAGGRPQVVWPNGILASSAVGLAVSMITGWNETNNFPIYLSYDGNSMCVTRHIRLDYELPEKCEHFPPSKVGEPEYKNV
ncbi:MAG TPA: ThiF family adenylyltransferase [Candidatus Udaeobacter sp.]|nr:ThiF family adenylyltransferase [Candidatus Udaeobacter sp.]